MFMGVYGRLCVFMDISECHRCLCVFIGSGCLCATISVYMVGYGYIITYGCLWVSMSSWISMGDWML